MYISYVQFWISIFEHQNVHIIKVNIYVYFGVQFWKVVNLLMLSSLANETMNMYIFSYF